MASFYKDAMMRAARATRFDVNQMAMEARLYAGLVEL
jgi:hypothetical protein